MPSNILQWVEPQLPGSVSTANNCDEGRSLDRGDGWWYWLEISEMLVKIIRLEMEMLLEVFCQEFL